MQNKVTFLRYYNYDICLAPGNIWLVKEAVDYVATHLANEQGWLDRQSALTGFMTIRDQLMAAVERSVREGSLVINEAYKEDGEAAPEAHAEGCDALPEVAEDCATGAVTDGGDIDFEKSTVYPFVFINWALASNIGLPKQFTEYAARKKSNKSGYYEGLGIRKTAVHHERCRAVAGMLWSLYPDTTIADMARRAEIIQFGCEGQEYDTRTICRWLASLKEERRPGRQKKAPVVQTLND